MHDGLDKFLGFFSSFSRVSIWFHTVATDRRPFPEPGSPALAHTIDRCVESSAGELAIRPSLALLVGRMVNGKRVLILTWTPSSTLPSRRSACRDELPGRKATKNRAGRICIAQKFWRAHSDATGSCACSSVTCAYRSSEERALQPEGAQFDLASQSALEKLSRSENLQSGKPQALAHHQRYEGLGMLIKSNLLPVSVSSWSVTGMISFANAGYLMMISAIRVASVSIVSPYRCGHGLRVMSGRRCPDIGESGS